MCFAAAPRRACGRAVVAGARADAPAWVASASGSNRRFECIGVPITRMRMCVRAMRGDFPVVLARSTPRLSTGARRARAARARGVRQVHRRHEGEGAARDARPVQALGGTVRPAPAAAAVRVCGGAGAALLREALPRRALWPSRAALDAAAAALPVVGRRPSPAHAWLARAADCRACPGWAGAARRRPHGWRTGSRTTASSRRCRRRPTGRTSRHCECPRRRAHTGPADCADAGSGGSWARRRARLGTWVCAYV
jgi:hypothetical protein